MDDATAIKALQWMAEPHKRGVGGPDVDYQGSVAFFGNGTAAFALNGEWEVTTFQAMKMKFGMTDGADDLRPPRQPGRRAHVRDPAQRRAARRSASTRRSTFISRLVGKGLDWAKGGHVPAYREMFESDEYRKLSPQSDYAEAAERVVFDPLAWYSGSGSNLETNAGSAFKPVDHRRPEAGAGPGHVPRLPGAREREGAARMSIGDGAARPDRGRARADRARRKSRDPRSSRLAVVFTGPFFVLFVLFLFWPVLSALWTSLFDDSLVGGSSWAGLGNYTELLDDPDFWAAMWHTALFTLLSVPPLVLLPLGLALMVSRVRRLQWLFRLAFFAPFVLPVSVVVLVWNWIYQPGFGLINSYLTSLGLRRGQLARPAGRRDGLGGHRHRLVDVRLQLRALPRRAAGDPARALRGGGHRRRDARAAAAPHHAAAARARRSCS